MSSSKKKTVETHAKDAVESVTHHVENVTKGMDKNIDGVTKWLASMSDQLPKFPKSFLDWVVKYLPVINVIFGVFGILGYLGYLALLGTFGLLLGLGVSIQSGSFLGLGAFAIVITVISLVLPVIQVGLLFMSYSPLQTKKYVGWKYTYWAQLLNVIGGLVSIVLAASFGSVIGVLISLAVLHILFQIKKEYK